MSNKYTNEQENLIISAMIRSRDLDTMKANLTELLKNENFIGMNIQELLSKANHLGTIFIVLFWNGHN